MLCVDCRLDHLFHVHSTAFGEAIIPGPLNRPSRTAHSEPRRCGARSQRYQPRRPWPVVDVLGTCGGLAQRQSGAFTRRRTGSRNTHPLPISVAGAPGCWDLKQVQCEGALAVVCAHDCELRGSPQAVCVTRPRTGSRLSSRPEMGTSSVRPQTRFGRFEGKVLDRRLPGRISS